MFTLDPNQPTTAEGIHPIAALGAPIRQKLTGALTLKSDKIVRQFHYRSGSVVIALSNARTELPGAFLLKKGSITQEQMNSYLEAVKKPKVSLWAEALKLLSLPPAEVVALKAEYSTKLASALKTVSAVSAQFQPGAAAGDAALDGVRFLIDALQEFGSAELSALCPDLNPATTVRADEKLEAAFGPLKVTPEEKGLLTVARNSANVEDVYTGSFLGKERIQRLLVTLWLVGLVELESAAITAMKKHDSGLTQADRAFAEEIRQKAKKLDQTNYYEWLGLDRKAKSDEIDRTAREWIEKLSAPRVDQLFLGEEKTIPALLKEKAQEARSALANPAQRAEYDAYLHAGKTGSFASVSVVGREEEALARAAELAKTGKHREAADLLKTAIKGLSGSQPLAAEFARRTLAGYGSADKTRAEEAVNALNQVLTSKSVLPEVYEAHAEWMEALGQNEKALDGFKHAVAVRPLSQGAQAGLTRLAPSEVNVWTLAAIHKNLKQLNFYELLGLQPRATVRDIQAAYREATKRFHPDRFFQSGNPRLKETANEVYKEMVRAYTTLKTPTRRSGYDGTLTGKTTGKLTDDLIADLPRTASSTGPTADLPRTQQGKKFYDLALIALRQGKLDNAKLNLKLGLQVEPGAAAFQKKLKELG